MGLISLKSVMSMEPKAGADDAAALGGVLCELLSQLPSSVSRRRGWKASSSSSCRPQHCDGKPIACALDDSSTSG